jgi:SPP1 family predicted phage head-tail adaptor
MLSSLSTRAALQANTLSPDAGGGYIQSWQTYALVWVKLVPVGASDTFASDQMQSRARHRVLLRRRGDVCPGHRLAVDSRTFRIHAVLDEGRQDPVMSLLCEELP